MIASAGRGRLPVLMSPVVTAPNGRNISASPQLRASGPGNDGGVATSKEQSTANWGGPRGLGMAPQQRVAP